MRRFLTQNMSWLGCLTDNLPESDLKLESYSS